MAQRYTSPVANSRMLSGFCPECGQSPEEHSSDPRFWVPRKCDLRIDGVYERIAQARDDRENGLI